MEENGGFRRMMNPDQSDKSIYVLVYRNFSRGSGTRFKGEDHSLRNESELR